MLNSVADRRKATIFLKKKRAVMKMQFLLIGLVSIALFGSTPVAVAHGGSGGGAGHGEMQFDRFRPIKACR